MFDNWDLISTYTRQQAIKDGQQVCVSEQFPRDTRMYKYPVYFTSAVWELCQGKGLIIWDICYLAALASKRGKNKTSVVQYSVIVQNASRKPDFLEDNLPFYQLIAECGATDIDNPQPAITIMFPEEH